ncbi:MAG: hypothetical protein Barrevirus25_7 [Barrevirus sp.]|uniref:Sel1 repeat protein n=1 Tax=Barrevirus sp. TaxID=2487763 RepID=A0A3G4ZSH5_9VIRU|nr:MAG: hypothetical protein Barrevirus25_7 [Barrevirus sp.]
MEEILSLTKEELYDNALKFKDKQDYTNYCMFMTMSANYDYELAKDDIDTDYTGLKLYKQQNHKITLAFYEATEQYGYSANYLGFMYENIKDNNNNVIEWWHLKATRYYELAIKKNNIHALNNLARLYKENIGVQQCYIKARELYEKSISINKKNNKYAFTGLLAIYKETDLKNDKETTIEYFMRFGKEHLLQKIYGWSKEHIDVLRKNRELEEQNRKLLKENEFMRIHIEMMPDSETFFVIKDSFCQGVLAQQSDNSS